MNDHLEDTIAAIATPIGEGAISVIRLSGAQAIELAAARFRGKKNLALARSHTVHFGSIVDRADAALDEVLCAVFRAPHSYTGEDAVEVSCHGGIHVTRRVLECFIEAGARPASPGEFTKRAFLNGKIDMLQAEAIADLIQAQSDKAHLSSLHQLEGRLSLKIESVREQLVKTAGLLELELDFAEENMTLTNKTEVEEIFETAAQEIEDLLGTYKYGKVLREGARVALIGAPNTGKSSLLNALLNENRAIVTSIPGTTRDFIEERITIDGILFRVIDTAGLRKTDDPIEEEGVRRTRSVASSADMILFVYDAFKGISEEEVRFVQEIKSMKPDLGGVVVLANKIDLQAAGRPPVSEFADLQTLEVSAVSHAGIEQLKSVLSARIFNRSVKKNQESVTITNGRHYAALLRSKEGLESALASLRQGESGEFIALDLRRAIDAIGEMAGKVTTEEILNTVFSRFCIGK